MTNKNPGNVILALSLPLSLLLIIASYLGVFVKSTYAQETLYFASQGIAQDLVDLVIVAPLLLITSFLAYQKSRAALLIWSGIIFYLIYSFAIYCFSVHFNYLFLVYCSIFGLSFYSFVYFVLSNVNESAMDWYGGKAHVKTVGIFLIVIAILFYFVWLSEIIPSLINHVIPKSIIDNGTIVNAVHVLDLTIFLPAMLITAILLSRKKALGFLLAPAMLIFVSLLALVLISMAIVMRLEGIAAEPFLVIIFSCIFLLSTIILVPFLKSLKGRSR